MRIFPTLIALLLAALLLTAACAETRTDAHGNEITIDPDRQALSLATLPGADHAARKAETALGDFWADALRWFAVSGAINEAFEEDDVAAGITAIDADEDHIVALWNGGNLRADLPEGVFGEDALADILPYPNKVAVVYMSGAELLEALEAAAQGLPYTEETASACAAFMQVSGLKYTVDAAVPFQPGEAYGDHWFRAAAVARVEITEVNGQPFDPEAIYAVITSNANFNGMDSSYAFQAAAQARENSTITTAVVREVVWRYISEALGGTVGEAYAQPQGRIEVRE